MTIKNNPAENTKNGMPPVADSATQRPAVSEEERLNTATQRILRFLPWLIGFFAAITVERGITLGAWQFYATAGSIGISFVTLIVAQRLAGRQHQRLAAYLIVFAVLFMFTFAGIFIANRVVIPVLALLVFTNILGAALLPKRMWWHSLAASMLASVLTVLLQVIRTPWARFDVQSAVGAANILYIILALGGIIILFELFFSYRRTTRIGVRLGLTFGLLAAASVAITTIASTLVVTNAVRTQVFDELETVAQLKRNAIQSWIDTLNSELGTVLIEGYELDRARAVLLREIGADYQLTARNELRVRFQGVIERNLNFIEINLIDLNGQVAISSNRVNEDKWVDHEPWFLLGSNGVYVDQPRYNLADGGLVLTFSQPVYDTLGFKIGVLAGHANLNKLASLVSASPAGATGKTYLVAGNHELIGQQRYVYSSGIDAALRGETAADVYVDYDGVEVSGQYWRLPEFNAALMTEIDESEVLTGTRQTIMINAIVAVAVVAAAISAAALVSRDISGPLQNLVTAAGRIAAGERDLRADITSDDEFGTLSRAFNSMTGQLQEFIDSLEQRVQERTDGLAAVGEVTRATTSELDIDQLLPSVVNTVRDRFNLYYVGLFLAAEQHEGRQIAVLRAATGEPGREMLAQNWQLEIGPSSMIGDSIFTGQSRVRQSSTERGPWQRNPYLPDTESELALPLRFGDRILGAMTVQSTMDNAFDPTAIELLQNMADQVAVAIENARLYTESRQALARAQLIQQRYQTRAWRDYLTAQDIRGIAYTDDTGTQVLGNAKPQSLPDGVKIEKGMLLIPIMQGDQAVGVMGFEGKQGGWQPAEIELLQALTEQLGQAAENQRLLDETQQRAAREQTVGQVADRLRQSLDMDTVLSTAASEIRDALGLERVVVRLATPEQSD